MFGLQRVYCIFVHCADVVAGVSRAFIHSVRKCVCVCQFVISQVVLK